MVAILALVLVGLVIASGVLAGSPASSGNSTVAGLPSNSASSIPAATARPSRQSTATPPRPSIAPTQQPRPTNGPSATPTSSSGGGGAPARPADFDIEGQTIDIMFPMRADTRYRYRDNFLDPRAGPPEDYNHARMPDDGTAHRLHDGIDIYAAQGEPLMATFSGLVVDPSTRWQPWERDRYGNTVVIESDEPSSEGYLAMFVHMDRVWVEPGTSVTRGQVIGTVGRTGNADDESVRTHLHFELRAPFLLDWSPLGEARTIDAFNPYPSLMAADPKRT